MQTQLFPLAAAAALFLALAPCAPARADDDEAPVKEPSRLRLAVLDFREGAGVAGGLRGGIGRWVANQLASQIMETGRFDLYERANIDQVLQQLRIDASGAVDDSTAAQIGKLAGVNYLVFGDVEQATVTREKFGNGFSHKASVLVSFRAVDVETGRIWKQKRQEGDKLDFSNSPDLREMANQATNEAINEFVRDLVPEVQAKVARCAPGRFIINAGSGSGLAEGMYLRVVREAGVYKDQTTGEALAKRQNVICFARVVQIIGPNAARVEPGQMDSGSFGKKKWEWKRELMKEIKVGDLVEAVTAPGKLKKK
jgi:curli biogenesis system outer membrane secretion channel CsgG